MAKASDESVATYLRIPKSAYETLTAASRHLEMPLSKVTNAIFHFTLSPKAFQDEWSERVKVLRKCIKRDGNKVCLYDFSARDWEAGKHQVYEWLEDMGLVEDFDWRRSNSSDRVICSFKISDVGRVIAEVFRDGGMMDAPELDDVASNGDAAMVS